MTNERVAYAKIVGTGWQYYMTKSKIILGRGGKGVECDIRLGGENAVSRQHLSIRYAPEYDAIEVENLSKNGILVNGTFVQQFANPVLVRAQTEIAYGRYDSMRITLIFTISNYFTNPATLKIGDGSENEKANSDWIGHALVSKPDAGTTGMTINQIIEMIKSLYPKLTPAQIASLPLDVRHIITQNHQLFSIVLPRTAQNPSEYAKIIVHPSAKQRFVQFAKQLHTKAIQAPNIAASNSQDRGTALSNQQ